MKKIGLFFLLFQLSLVLFAQNVIEVKPEGVYSEINVSIETELIEQLYSGDADLMDEAVTLITKNADKYNPTVLYVLSNVLFMSGKKSEAMKWFYIGQLRGRYDANRCADTSARQAIGILNSQFGTMINEYGFKHIDLLRKQVYAAVEYVKTHEENYDHRWINLHGIGAFMSSEEGENEDNLSLPENEWAAIKKSTIEEYLNGFETVLESLERDD